MSNHYFRFRQFIIHQDKCAMKVTTDACLFGAWTSEEIKKSKIKIQTGLDIGSGTGLISLMLAQKMDGLLLDAVEIDEDAAKQSKENISGSPFANRICVFQEDIKDFKSGKEYDIIISNPPFYENELSSVNKQKNIAHHSSGLLLAELSERIKLLLCPEGTFFLLLPVKRMEEAAILLEKSGLEIRKTCFVKQSHSHSAFRVMIKGGHYGSEKKNYDKQELSICSKVPEYTEEFAGLLKDYYLKL